eukprot:1185174-Rhodomonas_salina.2
MARRSTHVDQKWHVDQPALAVARPAETAGQKGVEQLNTARQDANDARRHRDKSTAIVGITTTQQHTISTTHHLNNTPSQQHTISTSQHPNIPTSQHPNITASNHRTDWRPDEVVDKVGELLLRLRLVLVRLFAPARRVHVGLLHPHACADSTSETRHRTH